MNDPTDDLLDARLREETPYLDDAGFTSRVMQQLPARPSSFGTMRAAIIFAAALLSVVIAYFASGEALFVQQGLKELTRLSPVMALALAMLVGVLFTVGGLWAALSRTRDPLV